MTRATLGAGWRGAVAAVLVAAGLPRAAAGPAPDNPPVTATVVEVKKIWDQAPHNAFTDLVRWNERFYCAFREGRGHASSDGRIRLLTSADGDAWESAAWVELADHDLRDAALSAMPDGRLMLLGGVAQRPKDNVKAPTGSFVSFSRDGRTWTPPEIVVKPGRWLWRVTWHGGKAYGVAYGASEGPTFTSLLAGADGLHFETVAEKMFTTEGRPTEAVLRFGEDGACYCLHRRDGGQSANSAFFGTSRPPYTDWTWKDLGFFFGGPNLIRTPPGWIGGGRLAEGGRHMALTWIDVEKGTMKEILRLPSGGDCSYPGLVWHDGLLWVSYYSSHEGKAAIYLAKVKLAGP